MINIDYNMAFSISALISSETPVSVQGDSRGLIWVKGCYQGRYGKCHVIICLLRDYYMTVSISTLILARDSHIKSDSEAGALTWVQD